MTALVQLVRDEGVINVRTGELLDLSSAAVDELAQGREGLSVLRREVDDASARLDAEIAARIDHAVRAGELDRYTVRVGGYEISVPSPEAGGEVDADALRLDLLKRVDAGEIDLTRHAVEGAFRIRGYTLKRSVFHTLAKQEPELEALLKAHTSPPRRRRATVTVLPGQEPVPVAADVIEAQESFPW